MGVSTVAELIVSSASPFNVIDELRISYFSFEQVQELIQQYVDESGQPFMDEVVRLIYENTAGQPGLVNGLCQYLVETAATDRSQPVTISDMYQTLKHFLNERLDKNIINIVQKARTKREFMLRLLFSDQPIEYTVDDPDIAYLFAHGVIDQADGFARITVPLYAKRLLTAFRPLLNGETQYYASLHDRLGEFVSSDGLNVPAILEKYRDYVRRRGFRAFDTAHLREAAWHYSLDGFINFFVERLDVSSPNRLGGQTLVEVPSGRGRTDILILCQQRRYIIETKIFTDPFYFEKGKVQLAAYLQSERLDVGYYVAFSSRHQESDQLTRDETIHDKRILTYIVCTNFDRPSDASPWQPSTM